MRFFTLVQIYTAWTAFSVPCLFNYSKHPRRYITMRFLSSLWWTVSRWNRVVLQQQQMHSTNGANSKGMQQPRNDIKGEKSCKECQSTFCLISFCSCGLCHAVQRYALAINPLNIHMSDLSNELVVAFLLCCLFRSHTDARTLCMRNIQIWNLAEFMLYSASSSQNHLYSRPG